LGSEALPLPKSSVILRNVGGRNVCVAVRELAELAMQKVVGSNPISRFHTRDTGRAMSEENVEIVKRANAALNAHDIDGLMSFLDPEYEFVDHMGAVTEESGSGVERMRRLIEGWIEVFPDFRAETEEYIDAGERVVCVTHWQGTGAGSELPNSQRAAEVYTLRKGKILRAELGFADKAAALKAAGLSE
jgi:ketosteroid isomerase-like protein